MRSSARAAAILAVSAVLLTGCAVSDLSFIQDRRVEIVQPTDRQQVSLPVTVRWTVEGFEVTGPTDDARPDAGYFGVFVDRAPQPPGDLLNVLAADDQACRPQDGCPDERYFAERYIYTTTDTRFVVDQVPRVALDERREFHEVTIVLLDGNGRRIGESAFSVEFQVMRRPR